MRYFNRVQKRQLFVRKERNDRLFECRKKVINTKHQCIVLLSFYHHMEDVHASDPSAVIDIISILHNL